MGLDTTYGCWNGPYSAFNRFRYELGRQIGINLDDYAGYNENGTKDLKSIDHNIQPLIDHSDCNGRLTITESKKIAKGLDDILKEYKPNPEGHDGYNEWMKARIEQFRDGCLLAIKDKQMIKFH